MCCQPAWGISQSVKVKACRSGLPSMKCIQTRQHKLWRAARPRGQACTSSQAELDNWRGTIACGCHSFRTWIHMGLVTQVKCVQFCAALHGAYAGQHKLCRAVRLRRQQAGIERTQVGSEVPGCKNSKFNPGGSQLYQVRGLMCWEPSGAALDTASVVLRHSEDTVDDRVSMLHCLRPASRSLPLTASICHLMPAHMMDAHATRRNSRGVR